MLGRVLMESKSDITPTREELDLLYKGIVIYGEKDQCTPMIKKVEGYTVNYLRFGTGSEQSSGIAMVIPDLEQVNIEALSTYDLTGCIGLAIRGTNKKTGKEAAFFGHMSVYDANLENNQNNMKHAIDFVREHKGLLIFWGTELLADKEEASKKTQVTKSDKESDVKKKIAQNWGNDEKLRKQEAEAHIQQGLAQKDLSNALGVWVRSNSFVRGKELTFFPHLPMLVMGEVPQAVTQCFSDKWQNQVINDLYSISSLHKLEQFQCDHKILQDINDYLRELKEKNDSTIRKIFYADRRKMKIELLDRAAKAYEIGDFDTLHAMKTESSPMKDVPNSSLAFAGYKSRTKDLVHQAWEDSLQKKRAEPTQGGLTYNGEHILGRDKISIQQDMKTMLQQRKKESPKTEQSDTEEKQNPLSISQGKSF